MKYFAAFLLLAVALSHGQDNTQAPKKTATHAGGATSGFTAAIQKLADEWRVGFQAKDVEKVAAMYSDDAVWINAEGTFHGTNQIKGELKKMIDRGDTVAAVMTTKAVHSGEIGFAEGTYSGTGPDSKGAEGPAHGSWVVSIKNTDGKWMLATHTSVPAATSMSKNAKKAE